MAAGGDAEATAARPLSARRYSGINRLGVATVLKRILVGEIMFFKLVILGPALQALLFALVISLAVGNRIATVAGMPFLEFLAPGLIVAAAVQRSFESTAFSIVYEKLEGTIADVFGAPLTAAEILTGYVLGAIGTGFLIGLPVWVILLPFGAGAPVAPLAALFFVVVGCTLLAMIGLMAGMRSNRWDSLTAKEIFILAPLLFLSGSFFSIEVLSEPFHTLMLANPVFHLVNGFRYGMTGHAEVPVAASAAVLIVLTIAVAVAALHLVRIGYRVKA